MILAISAVVLVTLATIFVVAQTVLLLLRPPITNITFPSHPFTRADKGLIVTGTGLPPGGVRIAKVVDTTTIRVKKVYPWWRWWRRN